MAGTRMPLAVEYVTRSAKTPGVGENVDHTFACKAGRGSGTKSCLRISARHASSRFLICAAESSLPGLTKIPLLNGACTEKNWSGRGTPPPPAATCACRFVEVETAINTATERQEWIRISKKERRQDHRSY